MTAVLDENISEKCPKCGSTEFNNTLIKATGLKKILSVLLSIFSLTHTKYDSYETVCANCDTEKKW